MKIVVGLGNPGKQYEGTRHNVGWMVLDRLAERAGSSGRPKPRDAAAVLHVRRDGRELALVKPSTFMNGSGLAVRKVLARERAPLEDLLVVVDDFALPLGRLRLRGAGSAGGHNGLRSIIGELGTQDFARLRVGIGEPDRSAIDHVLSRFTAAERRNLDAVLDAAADAIQDWAGEGISRAANTWNSWGAAPAEPAGSSELPGVAHGEPQPDPPAAVVGPDGIRRTRTGWRKLLPGTGPEPR